MPNRRIPVAVRLELKEELNRLTRLGVIEPVKNATPWVSQLVLTRKKNGAFMPRLPWTQQSSHARVLHHTYSWGCLSWHERCKDIHQGRLIIRILACRTWWSIKQAEELNRLTRLGVIEPVKNATPWVSQLVLTRKKNGAFMPRLPWTQQSSHARVLHHTYSWGCLSWHERCKDIHQGRLIIRILACRTWWSIKQAGHIPNIFWSIPLASTTFWSKLRSRNIPKKAGGAIPGHEKHHHCRWSGGLWNKPGGTWQAS